MSVTHELDEGHVPCEKLPGGAVRTDWPIIVISVPTFVHEQSVGCQSMYAELVAFAAQSAHLYVIVEEMHADMEIEPTGLDLPVGHEEHEVLETPPFKLYVPALQE